MESVKSELLDLLLKELHRWYNPEHFRFKKINFMIENIYSNNTDELNLEKIMECFSLNTPGEEYNRARELAILLTK